MSFPESVDTVTLTCGPVLDADGNPRAGVKLYAIPARHVFIAETMLRPGILSAATGADGTASLEVIATDSAGLCDITGATVTSFRYRIGLDDISTASSEREVYLPKAFSTVAYEDLVANTAATTPGGLTSTFAPVVSRIYLPVPRIGQTTSNVSLTTVGNLRGWALRDANNDHAGQEVDFPPGWTTYHVDMVWTNVNASGGDVVVRWDTIRYADDDLMTGNPTAGTQVTVTAPAQWAKKTSRIGTSVAVVPGGANFVRILRLGSDAADTLAGSIGLVALILTKAS